MATVDLAINVLGKFKRQFIIGSLFAISFSLSPKPIENILQFSEKWLGVSIDVGSQTLEPSLFTGIVGFFFGVGFLKFMVSLRWQLLRMLLLYRGWMYHPKAPSTKIWAGLVSFIVGRGPHDLLKFQDLLPWLPLPTLEGTCNKYLSVVKPLVSEAEYENTKKLVESFKQKEGPILQAHLQKRSWLKTNWLSEWWLERAYLTGRYSLAVNSNYYCLDCAEAPTTNQLARASNITYYFTHFGDLIFSKKLHVLLVNDLVPICMDGYKNTYSTCRIPGKVKDTLMNFKDVHHIVVIRKGVYFAVDVMLPDGRGGTTVITPQELRQQFQKIYDITEDMNPDTRYLAALTSLERTHWAETREKLLKDPTNLDSLMAVESALFHVVLDEVSPKDMTEQSRLLMGGDGSNRWFDVCATLVLFPNGHGGGVAEHATADAPEACANCWASCNLGDPLGVRHACHLVSTKKLYARMWEYAMSREKYDSDGEPVAIGDTHNRKLKPPHILEWNVKCVEKDMVVAKEQLLGNLADLELHVQPSEYGKGFVKANRMSPDGYFQMALQLAFYRDQNETPKTYESAATRMFAEGRTETIRPVSEHSVAFVKSMDDLCVSREQRVNHLKKAIHAQTQYKIDASNGYGCDRHMFGLYMASQELGMAVPKVFKDPICFAPDRLSTSQTPVKLTNDWRLETSSIGGGFGPVCADGYGVSYIIVGEDVVNFHVTSRHHSGRVSATRFGAEIVQAMRDMRQLFTSE